VKVVEAICHGVPVVSTSVGAQGLIHLEPRPFVLADAAPAFADATCGVLADEGRARALEQAAASIAPLFSPERAYLELDESLRSHGVAVPAGVPSRTGA
jgi:glycosyltransferase involved in cell wall biosynthesis